MSTTTVSRRIAADPTSVALLLADPAAVELWPQVTRPQDNDGTGPLTIEVGTAQGELHVLPPRRTPTAYVLRFDFDPVPGPGPAFPVRVEGRLELALASADEDAPKKTDAVLEVRSDRDLAADAEEFLRRVAAAAEDRSRAA